MMSRPTSKNRIYTLCAVFVAVLVALDQYSKHLARSFLSSGDEIVLIRGILKLQYIENIGAAFNILSGKLWIFYISTPVICIAVLYFFLKLPVEKHFLPIHFLLSALLAGAVGNFIDRIAFRFVTDFIYFCLIDFPVFNVADIYVTVSTFLLAVLIFFLYTDDDLKRCR